MSDENAEYQKALEAERLRVRAQAQVAAEQAQAQARAKDEQDSRQAKRGCLGCLAIIGAPFLFVFLLYAMLGPSAAEQKEMDRKAAEEAKAQEVADRKANPKFWRYKDRYGEPPDQQTVSAILFRQGIRGVDIQGSTNVRYGNGGWLIGCTYTCNGCGGQVTNWFTISHAEAVKIEPRGSYAE